MGTIWSFIRTSYQKQDMTANLEQSQKKVQENQQFLLPNAEKAYDKYFKKITELQVDDVIINNQCKFCTHPMRAEAEAKWELTKGQNGKGSYSLVTKFLNEHSDEYGVQFHYQNVNVHLNNHYEQQLKKLWMREYGQHLAGIMNYKIGKDEMFEAMIQATQLKLFEMAANPDIDVVKQADMMAKLTKSILDIVVVQAKLRGDIDTIDIYKEKFQNIIVNFIAKEQDSTSQRELIEQLDLAKTELKET